MCHGSPPSCVLFVAHATTPHLSHLITERAARKMCTDRSGGGWIMAIYLTKYTHADDLAEEIFNVLRPSNALQLLTRPLFGSSKPRAADRARGVGELRMCEESDELEGGAGGGKRRRSGEVQSEEAEEEGVSSKQRRRSR